MECMMYSLLTSSLRHPKRLNSQIEETLRCLCIIQAIIIKKLKKYNSLSYLIQMRLFLVTFAA